MMEDLSTAHNYTHTMNLASKQQQRQKRHKKYSHNFSTTVQAITIIYRASDIILSCNSDTTYLVAPKVLSQAGGYHYLGNKDCTQFNGSIYVIAKIINVIM